MLGDTTEPPRVAYSVGRNVGDAVTRNRVRRRLRASMREQASALDPGAGYLVRARPGAAQESYADLTNTLRAIIRGFSGDSA